MTQFSSPTPVPIRRNTRSPVQQQQSDVPLQVFPVVTSPPVSQTANRLDQLMAGLGLVAKAAEIGTKFGKAIELEQRREAITTARSTLPSILEDIKQGRITADRDENLADRAEEIATNITPSGVSRAFADQIQRQTVFSLATALASRRQKNLINEDALITRDAREVSSTTSDITQLEENTNTLLDNVNIPITRDRAKRIVGLAAATAAASSGLREDFERVREWMGPSMAVEDLNKLLPMLRASENANRTAEFQLANADLARQLREVSNTDSALTMNDVLSSVDEKVEIGGELFQPWGLQWEQTIRAHFQEDIQKRANILSLDTVDNYVSDILQSFRGGANEVSWADGQKQFELPNGRFISREELFDLAYKKDQEDFLLENPEATEPEQQDNRMEYIFRYGHADQEMSSFLMSQFVGLEPGGTTANTKDLARALNTFRLLSRQTGGLAVRNHINDPDILGKYRMALALSNTSDLIDDQSAMINAGRFGDDFVARNITDRYTEKQVLTTIRQSDTLEKYIKDPRLFTEVRDGLDALMSIGVSRKEALKAVERRFDEDYAAINGYMFPLPKLGVNEEDMNRLFILLRHLWVAEMPSEAAAFRPEDIALFYNDNTDDFSLVHQPTGMLEVDGTPKISSDEMRILVNTINNELSAKNEVTRTIERQKDKIARKNTLKMQEESNIQSIHRLLISLNASTPEEEEKRRRIYEENHPPSDSIDTTPPDFKLPERISETEEFKDYRELIQELVLLIESGKTGILTKKRAFIFKEEERADLRKVVFPEERTLEDIQSRPPIGGIFE